jgi:hypothetical protein
MTEFITKHPWISAGIGVVIIACIVGIIYAMWPAPTRQVNRVKTPDEPASEQQVNFIPSYNIQPGMYWAKQASCDAPGSGGLPGYCAFTGPNAWANAEQTCDADPECVGYANMIRGGKQYYVLGAPLADTTHPPNLYYGKPGAEMPKLTHADSSAYTIADVYKNTESGPSNAEIAGAVWRASR